MFVHTLPIVPLMLPLQPLPQSYTATSFWLPKMAEQGLGVPVREIDADYLPALQARLKDLLKLSTVQQVPLLIRHSLGGLVTEENPRVQHIVPIGGLMLTNYELDGSTSVSLGDLLLCKDVHQLDPTAAVAPFTKTRTLIQADMPYLRMLAGLEHTGIIDGIIYEYDVQAGKDYQDVRRIIIDARTLHQEHKRGALDKDHVLRVLDSGVRIDADAAPLRDFFDDALSHDSVYTTRRLSRVARIGVTPLSANRRPHDVMMTTIVEGR